MKVIFGDMEFGSFAICGEEVFTICIIRTVHAVMDLPDEDAADALLGQYESYVIPSMSEHTIVYIPGAWSAITQGEEA